MVLKRVGIWSVARMALALYGTSGLIAGILVALFSVVSSGIAATQLAESGMPAWIGMLFGAGAVVLLPLFYGVMGLIIGAIAAALYNVYSRLVGGIELDLQ